jgi:flagellar motor switch protein FliM
MQSDVNDIDDRWVNALRHEVLNCDVNLNCKIVEREILLRDLVDLAPGDVIPVDLPEEYILTANEVPMFRTKLGCNRGNLAMKILAPVKPPK